MDKIRISAVSYLNTKPFVYGLLHSELLDRIDLSLDVPSLCARKLTSGAVDLGLIPVAAIPDIPNAQIISDYCIASSWKVRTVMLVSHVPKEQISKVILDDQSRTSVQLCRILAKYHWHIDPEWENGEPGYFAHQLDHNTAAVVIGDRAFGVENRFEYCFDLGQEWKIFTGYDFVFACWVANKTIDNEFVIEFNKAMSWGVHHIDEVIKEYDKDLPDYRLNEYFYENIRFVFDESKRKGLEMFMKLNETIRGKI